MPLKSNNSGALFFVREIFGKPPVEIHRTSSPEISVHLTMKKIILVPLIFLCFCKKKDKAPAVSATPTTPNPVVTPPLVRQTNTITIYFKTHCKGYEAYVNAQTSDTSWSPWDTQKLTTTKDSNFVTVITDRRYFVYAFSGEDKPVAGNWQPCNVDVRVMINDTLYKTWQGKYSGNEHIKLY